MKLVTVVLPVHSERENIAPVFEELLNVFNEIKSVNLNVLFVDDGSLDDTVTEIEQLMDKDKRISLLEFTRNFGKEAALTAGIHHSSNADAVITMDADLQHPPNLIPEMLRRWQLGDDVIVAVKEKVANRNIFRNFLSVMYYFLLKSNESGAIIEQATDFRLLDRKVILEFNSLDERIHIFRGSIDWLGFKTSTLNFEANERLHGAAKYSYPKLIKLGLRSLTSFSFWPLRTAGLLGLLISTLSLILIFVCSWINLATKSWVVTPLALFVVFNTFLMGLVMLCIGLVALYVESIQTEVRKRPNYVVAKKRGNLERIDYSR